MSVYTVYQLPDGGGSITRSVSEDGSALQVIGAIARTAAGDFQIVRTVEDRLVGLRGASIEAVVREMADTLAPHDVTLKLLSSPAS